MSETIVRRFLFWTIACVYALVPGARAWIDYTDKVPAGPAPGFGKPFVGISLKLELGHAEFELGTPEPLRLRLRNDDPRSTLLPPGLPPGDRRYALHLILASQGGTSYFSRNLLADPAQAPAGGQFASGSETVVWDGTFDQVGFAPVDKVALDRPDFPPAERLRPSDELTPELYVLSAVLLSQTGTKKPDFVVASAPWTVLLRPVRGERLAEAERQQRLAKYLARLREGAYGGMAVSSQLAALGEIGVAPLIELADRTGDEKTRESRIWAIVTLCNTGSARAADYIRHRLQHPVDLRDLPFLAWHSLACRNPASETELLDLMRLVAAGQRLPWQDEHPDVSDGIKDDFIEFASKHFKYTGQSLPDEIVANCLKRTDPKSTSFALEAWRPASAESAITVLLPAFAPPCRHPNLKRLALRRLADAGVAGVTAPGEGGDVAGAWYAAGCQFADAGKLAGEARVGFLRTQVLELRTPQLRADAVRRLATALPAFPVKPEAFATPEGWVQAWQWTIAQGGFRDEDIVRFLADEAARDAQLTPAEKTAILKELSRPGHKDTFPAKDGEAGEALDQEWPKLLHWLAEKKYLRSR